MRHRVVDFRAGDLERYYSTLGVEEDFFINYGFVTAAVYAPQGRQPDPEKVRAFFDSFSFTF